ncbi:uncharacterized protein LOC130520393 isoform X1 [Takifugu flavidus]|uniref:uncharacterized protein LOC130520393 isoform X1 n=1 Tax=Takifugu flavidus TaxID=433684 RepID=UPI002544111E|nr:uncharacterized protein LOC130520393 isoform X1 [Takifugu flavidus]XP_056880107.1 uncharacterized protein LOC130520393 isoform X1 [Takifugu flavidus]
MIVDFRKVTAPLPPLALMDSPITIVDSFHFLGTTITRDLKWEPTISSLIKKAQQRMFFLRQLRKLKLPPRMLAQFYTAIIESILTSSITVWFAGATARDRLRLQRVVRAAEKVIGCRLPSIQDLYISRTRRRAGRITADPSHPGHGLFSPPPPLRQETTVHSDQNLPLHEQLLPLCHQAAEHQVTYHLSTMYSSQSDSRTSHYSCIDLHYFLLFIYILYICLILFILF